MSVGTRVEPFAIDVDQALLDDLVERLGRTRLPVDHDNEDWSYGTNSAYLGELVEYWRDGYDWRAQERAMNEYSHFRATIDDIPIHFLHSRGTGPDPVPIILSHGWPWTFWDWRKVIGALTDPAAHGGDPADSFDVVIPSLPGFGFSTPLPRAGVSWIDTADIWRELMVERLGYRRFFAAGADWGTAITSQLGHKFEADVAGIHVMGGRPLGIWNGPRPWDLLGSMPADPDPEGQARSLRWQARFAAHVSAHVLGSQTLANALQDSPAGLCSWILERRRSWSDCNGEVETRFSKDDLLTTMTIYWVTGSIGSSMRYYREAVRHPWQPSHPIPPEVRVPSAISVFRPDALRIPDEETLAPIYNVCQLRVHDAGGHFAAAEEPQAIITDIRDAFRPLRHAVRG